MSHLVYVGATMKRIVFFLISFFIFANLANALEVKLLVKNATIITMEKSRPTILKKAYMVVNKKGFISEMATGTPPTTIRPTQTLDAAGKVIIPGFLSGHSHLWQSAFRGFAPNSTLWGWIQAKKKLVPKDLAKAGDLRLLVLHGIYDYLSNGITTTYHHSQNPTGSSRPNEEQFYAHLEAPQRFIFSYRLPKGGGDDEAIKKIAGLRKVGDSHPQFLGFSIGGLGLFGKGSAATVVRNLRLARTLGMSIQTHYLEGPTLKEQERKNFQLLIEQNGLGDDITFAHFIHPDEKILSAAGAAGLKMIWNPLSNGRLASGLADIPKYLKYGIKVGMGLDGQGSADLADPFENMRMGLYSLRMKYQQASIMTPYQILELHTRKTAEVLNVADKVGSLEVGKYGDFLLVNLAKPDLGTVTDLLGTLVFGASARNVEEVYVGGRLVIQSGSPHNDPVYTQLKSAMPELMKRYGYSDSPSKP